MSSSAPRTLVLGDLHLVRETPRAVTDDLAAFVAAHAGDRLVFAGDLFDLPADGPRRPWQDAVAGVLGAHPAARAARARHLDTGGELWVLGGNHDADLGAPGAADALVAALGASPASRGRVRASPWFLREGGLHLEHGHLYDPDNAPAHPLVQGASSLGVHFVEEFIAPAGAHHYLQVNDATPLKLFLSSFTWYGARAPYVIFRYFYAAFGALFKSGPFYRASGERARGHALAEVFAADVGVPRAVVDAVLAEGAQPTLESLAGTFSRLYFDRVIATVAIAGGLGAALAGHRAAGGAAAALGSLLMAGSWARGHDRYAGTVAERLSRSADRIARETGAELVIFGHTHREAESEPYANTGSFAFPRGAPGRPYLLVEAGAGRPRAVRRHFPATA
jgi:UDP-2,3-diacylglucosamine pyrophosphatase LpxH